MPSSLITSLFGSASSELASGLDAMRSAESSLLSFARRFDHSDGDDHTMEVIDTKIPRSVVPLDDTSKYDTSKYQCAIFASDATQAEGADEDDHLIMHGIKVTSDRATSSATAPPPLVLLHGYANGALYFYRNLLGLSRHHYGEVYALDMLGWGLSSRPPFPAGDGSIESAESFFVDSLEAWREANGLDRMTLGGHSLGGYLSVAYCERHPERVDRLILLSPVGVPRREEDPAGRKDVPLRYRLMFGLARYLFDRGTTPGSFIRSLPESHGRKVVEGYVERRLASVTCPEEKSTLIEYLYVNAILPGSGEYCLNRLLTPTAQARRPAVDRIPHLNVDNVSFVYGELDWMDPSGGLEAQRLCDEMKMEGKKAPQVHVHGVRDAGHLLMMENWEGLNAAVIVAGGGEAPRGSPRPIQFTYSNKQEFFKRPSFGRQYQKSINEQPRAEVDPVGA